jgi:ribosomal protein RSM22 (predicted rRNA methylase)
LADPDFSPKTLFDFGSGIGTTMWAANDSWPCSIGEHFNIDYNKDLNNLAHLLLKCGDDRQPPIYNNVLYREFLPVGNHIQYDLIVSAFSLKELPSFQSRVQVLENLWHKTQDTLVIVEHGNRAGFSVIMEARNLILKLGGYDPTAIYSSKENPETQLVEEVLQNQCHIVAPVITNSKIFLVNLQVLTIFVFATSVRITSRAQGWLRKRMISATFE